MDAPRPVPESLQLDYAVDGSRVLVTAYLLFDQGDAQRRFDSHHKQRLGVYSARLNESVSLADLRKAGFEPFTIKVVTAKPSTPTHPTLLSKAPSIRIGLESEDRESYTLALHNISSKAVTGVVIGTGREGDYGMKESTGPHLLIPGGGTYRCDWGLTHSGRVTPHGFGEDQVSITISVEGALFDGGSFEGDVAAVAPLEARRTGYEAQRQRVARMFDSVLREASLTDELKVGRIRLEVSKLPSEADPATLQAVRSFFANSRQLPGAAELGMWIRMGIENERQNTLTGLAEFERGRTSGRGPSLAQWWKTWSGK
jgi:hypothetical protein